MKWLLLVAGLAIVIASLAPTAQKECGVKGGTMVYAGKMAWCHMEER